MKNLNRAKKTLISTLSVLALCAILFSCDKMNCIKGQGAIETRALSVPSFTGIDLDFSVSVTIKQGATQEVKAIGHGNIIDKIKLSVEDGVCEISTKGNDECFKSFQLTIEITTPNINSITISSAGDVLVKEFTNQSGELATTISGSGNITLSKFEGITSYKVNITGSGVITPNDDITTLKDLEVTLSGVGDYSGFGLHTENAVVDLSGTGNIELTANTKLDVSISGVGDIRYKGKPSSITQKITGIGELINAN